MSIKKETVPTLPQCRSQDVVTSGINGMIPRSGQKVNNLKVLRVMSGITAKEIVEAVRTVYPKYDKALQSKCENGELYGIRLRPDAMRMLTDRYLPDRKRQENRKKPNRVHARLTDAAYEQLMRILQREGKTMQDFLETLILQYIERNR